MMKKRTERHAARIQQMIENSPGERVDVATLRHRAAKMTPEERSESARKAAEARWAKKRQQEDS